MKCCERSTKQPQSRTAISRKMVCTFAAARPCETPPKFCKIFFKNRQKLLFVVVDRANQEGLLVQTKTRELISSPLGANEETISNSHVLDFRKLRHLCYYCFFKWSTTMPHFLWFILVGALWGCTNPLLKSSSANSQIAQDALQPSAPSTKPFFKFLYQTVALLLDFKVSCDLFQISGPLIAFNLFAVVYCSFRR